MLDDDFFTSEGFVPQTLESVPFLFAGRDCESYVLVCLLLNARNHLKVCTVVLDSAYNAWNQRLRTKFAGIELSSESEL